MQFDPITPESFKDAFQLQCECHAFPWSEKSFVDCLTPPYFAEQVLIDGAVVGYYVGLLVSVEATLMDIGVDSSCRGQGIGKALLQQFLRQCNKRQALDAWLEVRKSNSAAINLYREMGFTLIEERKNYYPAENGKEDALIMKLELGK